jgi:SAM-dependent methyltransferase
LYSSHEKNAFGLSDSPDTTRFLDEIAARLRSQLGSIQTDGGMFDQTVSSFDRPLAAELINGIETGRTLAGVLPPQPPTLRGRLGRALVELVRRSLFWYTPVIQAFQRAVAATIKEQNESAAAVWNEFSRKLSLVEKQGELLDARFRKMEEASRLWVNLDTRLTSIENQAGSQQRLLDRVSSIEQKLIDVERRLLPEEALVNKEHFTTVFNDVRDRLNTVAVHLEQQSGLSNAHAAELKSIREELAQAVRKFETTDRFALSTRAEMMLVERRMSALLKGSGQQNSSDHHGSAERPQLLSDAMYYEFETLFRGTEQQIRERVSFYLPRFIEAGLGTPEMPIVDIGCGRGEWLTVVREHRLLAYGVDSNSSMIATCRANGLAVEEQDGIQHLQSLADSSIGAVTAFHFIEHLPFGVLLSFIDEVLRVLKPGGVALLETPNPDNVLVGACTFYIDPTHQRPIPSGLLKFVMQSRGFLDIDVIPLHPYPSSYHLDTANGPAAQVINERMFGCQDYGLIAKKP